MNIGMFVLYPICFDDEIFYFIVNPALIEFLIAMFHARIHSSNFGGRNDSNPEWTVGMRSV